MKKFSAQTQKWLKGIHILFAVCWTGAGINLLLLQIFLSAPTAGARYGIDLSMKFIDDFIIIPAAMCTLLSGIIYALFTNWGWFKHNWITVKWIICVGGIIFGTFWLGPWMNTLPPISREFGLAALNDPAYVHARSMNSIFGGLQAFSLVCAVFISTLKPWKKKRK